MNLINKKICVTGANGFIGKRLVEILYSKGYSVKVLIRNLDYIFPDNVEIFYGDLTSDFISFENFLFDCDVIIHCAGELSDLNKMNSLHVDGTKRLLKGASKIFFKYNKRLHWVQLSSVGAYGPPSKFQSDTRIVTEHFPDNPLGEYELTKTFSDSLVIEAGRLNQITYTIVRPSNVFGITMKNQSLFELINIIDRGLFFYIGKPGSIMNYIHVDNVVESLIKCAISPFEKGKIFIVSEFLSLEQFVNIVCDVLSKRKKPKLYISEPCVRFIANALERIFNFPLTQNRIDALVNKTIYSDSSIRNELDMNYIVSLEVGLRQMVKEYKSKIDSVK